MVKKIDNSNIVHRLRATNICDQDFWATKNMKMDIEYWSKNCFPHGSSEMISYIPIDELIKLLTDDVRKLKAIKELDHPDRYGEEIGSEIHATDEWGDSGEASTDTLIDYIENLIEQLKKCAEY